MNTQVVIMAGGIGSRFWPLSTPEYPKQFIDILGCGRTLIQLTVDRFKGICPMSNFWVVTNAAYVDIVRQQLPDMPVDHILAEPAARNTAPCIAWACWRTKQESPNANVVVTPADAVVMNPEEFRRVIAGALAFTEGNNAIVTVGIKPNRPETGYGYIKCGKTSPQGEIMSVEAFKE
ncbi:MAG: NTP transferase domain-containing protein, partial [Bacteroidales bacterium]|nr:NTP transferase domain-containing protein [Bacteroidales bacterium]